VDLLDPSSSPESSRRPPRHRRPVLPVVAQWLCGASRSQDPSPPHLRASARSRPVAASSQPAQRTSATSMAPPRRASGEIPLPPPRLFKGPPTPPFDHHRAPPPPKPLPEERNQRERPSGHGVGRSTAAKPPPSTARSRPPPLQPTPPLEPQEPHGAS
jgi:hypothetical protein